MNREKTGDTDRLGPPTSGLPARGLAARPGKRQTGIESLGDEVCGVAHSEDRQKESPGTSRNALPRGPRRGGKVPCASNLLAMAARADP